MSLTAEERKAIVESRIEKSRRAYGEARGIVALKYRHSWKTSAWKVSNFAPSRQASCERPAFRAR